MATAPDTVETVKQRIKRLEKLRDAVHSGKSSPIDNLHVSGSTDDVNALIFEQLSASEVFVEDNRQAILRTIETLLGSERQRLHSLLPKTLYEVAIEFVDEMKKHIDADNDVSPVALDAWVKRLKVATAEYSRLSHLFGRLIAAAKNCQNGWPGRTLNSDEVQSDLSTLRFSLAQLDVAKDEMDWPRDTPRDPDRVRRMSRDQIYECFARYGFKDSIGHPLRNCADFIALVERATSRTDVLRLRGALNDLCCSIEISYKCNNRTDVKEFDKTMRLVSTIRRILLEDDAIPTSTPSPDWRPLLAAAETVGDKAACGGDFDKLREAVAAFKLEAGI